MNKKFVKKSNYLNRFTFYSSSVQLKILAMLLCAVKDNPNQETYRLHIQDILKDFAGSSEENYTNIKRLTKSMMKIIEIPDPEGCTIEPLFYHIRVEMKGIIEFRPNPGLVDELLTMSQFTTYYLKNIIPLKSTYSIRVYEILKQYYNQDKKICWFTTNIEDLRKILGVESSKYPLYGNFKNKVILTAQKELEEKTDLAFTFEEHKRGNRVIAITFYIKSNIKETRRRRVNEHTPRRVNEQIQDPKLAKSLEAMQARLEKEKQLEEEYKKTSTEKMLDIIIKQLTDNDESYYKRLNPENQEKVKNFILEIKADHKSQEMLYYFCKEFSFRCFQEQNFLQNLLQKKQF